MFKVSPLIFVPNQLVGAPAGTNVTIDCQTEAYPRAMNYWFLGDEMILSNEKYTTTTLRNSYRSYMSLTIRNLQPDNFGNYRCISKNSLGETEGSIRLYEMPKPSAAPKATEIRSSANNEGESLIECIALRAPKSISRSLTCPGNHGLLLDRTGYDEGRRLLAAGGPGTRNFRSARDPCSPFWVSRCCVQTRFEISCIVEKGSLFGEPDAIEAGADSVENDWGNKTRPGRPSTPSPAKRPTTVWPSSYNPYYTKRTERPPPPSEERVERPEQKLRSGQSTAVDAANGCHTGHPRFLEISWTLSSMKPPNKNHGSVYVATDVAGASRNAV
ncbi:Neurotrimin [Eufriesea mexicana]|uniref:Neurotrimin n=1 Tax=Eufriesea mexicana TaxID=516756 RepID=A0A310SF20_9HYME|nr:Neurotrimin [Eufriesea mexicana]